MAERAHPDDAGFRDRWQLRFRRGWLPWVSNIKSPLREAVLWRYRWVSAHCAGKDVLDVPCGMGWGTSLLRGCRSISGMDLSKEAIDEARSRYGRIANFQVGNMAELPYPSGSFDAIACLEGIEHVSIDVAERFLQEASRVLRVNGEIFLSSPHCVSGDHSGNPFHVHEYKPEELRALLEKHFFVEHVQQRRVWNLIVSYFRAGKNTSFAVGSALTVHQRSQ